MVLKLQSETYGTFYGELSIENIEITPEKVMHSVKMTHTPQHHFMNK